MAVQYPQYPYPPPQPGNPYSLMYPAPPGVNVSPFLTAERYNNTPLPAAPTAQQPMYLPTGGGSASPYGTAAGLLTGATSGAATGAMLGMAGGPLAALTVPGGALLGAGIGALGAGLSGYAASKSEKKSRALQRELLEKQLAVQKDQIETAKKQRRERIDNAAMVARAMMAAR